MKCLFTAISIVVIFMGCIVVAFFGLVAIAVASRDRSDAPSYKVVRPRQVRLSETFVQGVRLQPKSIVPSKLTLLVPQGWVLMSQGEVADVFPPDLAPNVVMYRSTDRTAAIAVLDTGKRLSQRELIASRKAFDRGFTQDERMSATPAQTVAIAGHEWLKVSSVGSYNRPEITATVLATSVKRRALFVYVFSGKNHEQEWAPIRSAIIQSLRPHH